MIDEVLDVPDNVPQEVLENAECVIVIPSMTKVGHGLRRELWPRRDGVPFGSTFTGASAAAAMYAIEGRSFGLQLGAEFTDVVMIVMNPRGVEALLSSKVKLGGEASAAAGPKGRHVEASTDASMRAEILSYLTPPGTVCWRFARRFVPSAGRRRHRGGVRTRGSARAPSSPEQRERSSVRSCARGRAATARALQTTGQNVRPLGGLRAGTFTRRRERQEVEQRTSRPSAALRNSLHRIHDLHVAPAPLADGGVGKNAWTSLSPPAGARTSSWQCWGTSSGYRSRPCARPSTS